MPEESSGDADDAATTPESVLPWAAPAPESVLPWAAPAPGSVLPWAAPEPSPLSGAGWELAPGPPPPPRRRRRRGLVGGGVAAIVVISAGAAAAVLLTRGGTHHWPARWDPRVAPIAAFDEAHRGLKFLHPVPVVFLDDTAFKKKLTGDGPSTTAKSKAQEARDVAELRALGLTTGSPDIYGGSVNVVNADVEGFYSFTDKTVWVRGSTITPHLRVILAHELTHVLQDQHFGVHHPKGDDADEAYTALVEGDAVRIQDQYLASMSPADQKSFQQAEDAVGAQASKVTDQIPPFLLDGQQFPYTLGPPFLDAIVKAPGGIDAAFRTPPPSTLAVISPSRYLAGGKPVQPPTARLATGQVENDPSVSLGAFALYEVLADRLDVGVAWKAASTWNGDTGIGYTAKGRECVADEIATTDKDAALTGALRGWAAAAASGTVTVTTTGGYLRLDACDPGAAAHAAAPSGSSTLDALDALVVRSQLAAGVASSPTLSRADVDCVADVILEVAGTSGIKQLVSVSNAGDAAATQQYFASLGVRIRPAILSRCPTVSFG